MMVACFLSYVPNLVQMSYIVAGNDPHYFVPDVRLTASCQLTSGSVCGHVGVVVLHLYTKLRENIFIQCRCIIMLRNSIWPPSAILDFFGEVVGPPTKAYSWWLSLVKFCSDRLRRVQVISIWIFVLYSWKSYSWAQKFFLRFDSKNLGELESLEKAHPCAELRIFESWARWSKLDVPCSSSMYTQAFHIRTHPYAS